MATANLAKGIGYTQVLVKGISHVTATPVHQDGDKVLYKGDEYTYVYAKTTCPVGYAVQLSAATGYSVTISNATDTGSAMGVVKHVAIPSGEHGWVVTKGMAPTVGGNNTSIDLLDKVIMVGTTNTGNMGRKTYHTAYSQLANEPTPFAVCVQAVETAGSGGNGTVYVF